MHLWNDTKENIQLDKAGYVIAIPGHNYFQDSMWQLVDSEIYKQNYDSQYIIEIDESELSEWNNYKSHMKDIKLHLQQILAFYKYRNEPQKTPAVINAETINEIKRLMSEVENCGRGFLNNRVIAKELETLPKIAEKVFQVYEKYAVDGEMKCEVSVLEINHKLFDEAEYKALVDEALNA